MNFKKEFAQLLSAQVDGQLTAEQIEIVLEKPKQPEHGDLAFPCFSLAKIFRQAPQKIAAELSEKISSPLFEKVEVAGGYVNVFFNKETAALDILKQVLSEQGEFGRSDAGTGGVMTIDMSSPNIAKPFSMGHLRSTVIGNSIALIAEKSGFKPFKINHLGDWGTQFGKLITAYKLWGSEEKVSQNPIKELLSLYVKFHEEAINNPSLEDDGRLWFKKLENGNEEAMELWTWFRDESLKEFTRIYDLLGIEFDSSAGEAFYNDKMDRVIDLIEEKGLLVESDDAKVVDLSDLELPPCLIKKSDGATLYATRDLAAALYRKENYNFVQSLYVVGNEQSLHFKQLIAVLDKMGYEWANTMKHIPFGMMLKDGKKMSTRKGKVILLEEVLAESIAMSAKNIQEKNPNLTNKDDVARMVGVGAVVFHDLKNYRLNDIEFSLEDMLRFEGETGPYIQYTYARACSILRKGNWDKSEIPAEFPLSWTEEWKVITALAEFPEAVKRAMDKYDPSQIAKYVIDLSREFNKYYAEVKILEPSEKKPARLALVSAVTMVVKEGLRLLGMEAPEEM
ncbi:arginine--tRNA ligase [Mesobacillus zeae]|uniref:Arginine--tRNA ligase n=1 Tax=Mesobacillus zeae TaxID=1917180 RepID=A0A398BLW9_9BACI|nr:arginine--tRNA ligase [Mesobacillus zeae]RID88363.1 arginine--tRNA ligase [Mesobacillus zeae]